jgi:hypothetical protein
MHKTSTPDTLPELSSALTIASITPIKLSDRAHLSTPSTRLPALTFRLLPVAWSPLR